jgi:peptide/nickel transport system substrate-binding protein
VEPRSAASDPAKTKARAARRRAVTRSAVALSFGLGAVSAAQLGGAASAAPAAGHVLHLSFLQDPGQPPDPDVYYAGEGLLLTRNMYEGLVQYQPGTATRKIVPSLATSWTVSANHLTYTFQLRHGVTFHDGTPFTSAAVEPSFARRAAVNGGPAYMVSDVKSVTTPNPYEVIINLKTPNTAFMDYLAAPYGPVMESPTALKAHAGKDHDQTYLQTHDIGTGPYELTESKVGVAYAMKAYPGYWGKKPYFTTVDLPVIDDLSTEEIQFNDGQLAGILHDLTTSAASSYEKNKADSYYELPTLRAEYVYVNEYKGFLTSQAARTDLLRAIDVKNIVAAVFPGGRAVVAPQMAPAHMLPLSFAKQTLTYDPSGLKSVVSKAPSAEKNIIVGYDTGSPDDQLIAEQVGAELLGEGLTAKVVGYQTSEIFGWIDSPKEAKTAAPNMMVDYFWPDADNPYTWSHISYDPGGGVNLLSCDVPGVAAIDAKAVETGSNALYNQVSNMALNSGCWMSLADENDTMVFKPSMKGVVAAHVVAEPEMLLLADLYQG